MSREDHYRIESHRLAHLIWRNDDGEDGERGKPLDFCFVLSLALDPDQDENMQRRAKVRVKAADIGHKLNAVIASHATRLLAGESANTVAHSLQATQACFENIVLARSEQELADSLYRKFLSGDNFAELGYLWCSDKIAVGACYCMNNFLEPMV